MIFTRILDNILTSKLNNRSIHSNIKHNRVKCIQFAMLRGRYIIRCLRLTSA